MPDIVVVGLQEIVKLNFMSAFTSNTDSDLIRRWTELFQVSMNQVNVKRGVTEPTEQYTFFQQQEMAGLCILLFCKKKMLNRIKELYLCDVKAGWGGYGKNKGCVAMRFRIDQTSFAFLNCHLESGEGNVLKRLDMLKTILEKTFTENKFAPDVAHHDI